MGAAKPREARLITARRPADMRGNLVARTVGLRHAELDVLRPVIAAA